MSIVTIISSKEDKKIEKTEFDADSYQERLDYLFWFESRTFRDKEEVIYIENDEVEPELQGND